jgi:hypothetical protein
MSSKRPDGKKTNGNYPDLFHVPVAELLDLETWNSATGTTSIFGPVCPHCYARFQRAAVESAGEGLYHCVHCLREFTLQFVSVGGKRAYRTWRLDEPPSSKAEDLGRG